MLTVFVLALALFQGSLVNILHVSFGEESSCEEKLHVCNSHLDRDALRNVHGLPNAGELRRLCPGARHALRCVTDIQGECDINNPFVLESVHDQFFNNLLEITENVCDETSDIHKKYVKNSECITRTLETASRKCAMGARGFYQGFLVHRNEVLGEVDRQVAAREEKCLQGYLFSFCLEHKTNENCGEDASELVYGFFDKIKIAEVNCAGLDYLVEPMATYSKSILDSTEQFKKIFSKMAPKIGRSTLHKIRVKAGQSFHIEANVIGEPPPTLTWSLRGRTIESTNRIEIISEEYSTRINVRQAKRADNGVYTLLAVNEHGKDETEVEVVVYVAPEILRSTYLIRVKAGQSFHLEANVIGEPPPTLTWYLRGSTIESTDRIEIISEEYSTRINVRQAKRDDNGEYTLLAVNEHGKDETEVEVFVYDVPLAPKDLSITDVTKEGCTVSWKPPDDDGGRDIQHYTVEKKDMETGRWVQVDETINTYLHADKLIEQHEYIFRVKAVNREGSSQWTMTSQPIVAKNPFGLVRADSEIICRVTIEGCATQLDTDALRSLRGLPDAQELRRICPVTKGFLQCVRNSPSECSVEDNVKEEFTVSDVDDVIEIVERICDENSETHRRYIEHAPCLNKTIEIQGENCIRGTETFLKDYFQHQMKLEGILDEKTAEEEGACLAASLMSSCLSTKTYQRCGEEASGLVEAFFEELIIVSHVCSSVVDLDEKINIFLQDIPEEYIEELFAKKK